MATKSEITTLEDVKKETAVVQPAAQHSGLPGACGERAILTIHSNTGSDGMQDVDCGINGYGFQIRRDTPVNVPIELVTMLQRLTVTSYDGKGVPSDRPRYAISTQPA